MVDSMMVAGPDWLRKQLESASPDLMREMLDTFIAASMSAEVDAECGAGYGQVSPDRSNSRNGYRHRSLDTLCVPKTRPRQATAEYWWRMPPSRSRRRMRLWSRSTGSGSARSGAAACRARWVRCSL